MSTKRRVSSAARLILSQVAGLLASMVVIAGATYVATLLMFEGDMSAPPTTPYLLLNLIYTAVAGAVGGWVAVRIGGGRLFPALLLGGIVLLLLLAGGGSPAGPEIPTWYTGLMPFFWAIGAPAGGWLGLASGPSGGAAPRVATPLWVVLLAASSLHPRAARAQSPALPGEFRDAPSAFFPPPLDPTDASLVPQEIGRGVWVLRGDRGAVDNVGVVVGEEHVLLVDSHTNARMAGLVREAVARITAKPIRYVVNTNRHGDHVFGNASFPEAVVISHEGQRLDSAAFAEEKQVLAAFIGTSGYFDDVEYRGPDITVVDSLRIDLGDRHVVVEHAGTLNSEGDVIVRVPDEGIVFSGNLLTETVVPLLWSGTATEWVAFVDRIASLEPRLIVPGHLGPVTPDRLAGMRAYGGWLDAAVSREVAAGRSARDVGEGLELDARFLPPGPEILQRVVRGFHALNALRTAQALAGGAPPTR